MAYLAGAYLLWFFGISCGRITCSSGAEIKGNIERDGRLTDFSEFILGLLEFALGGGGSSIYTVSVESSASRSDGIRRFESTGVTDAANI